MTVEVAVTFLFSVVSTQTVLATVAVALHILARRPLAASIWCNYYVPLCSDRLHRYCESYDTNDRVGFCLIDVFISAIQ